MGVMTWISSDRLALPPDRGDSSPFYPWPEDWVRYPGPMTGGKRAGIGDIQTLWPLSTGRLLLEDFVVVSSEWHPLYRI